MRYLDDHEIGLVSGGFGEPTTSDPETTREIFRKLDEIFKDSVGGSSGGPIVPPTTSAPVGPAANLGNGVSISGGTINSSSGTVPAIRLTVSR